MTSTSARIGVSFIAIALSMGFSSAPLLAADKERDYFDGLEYRNIGPFRGGRVTAVAGVPSDPHVYYMGATGGGVWKTINAGHSWENISDDFFKMGSVGAIDVSISDPNVIVVGMGESPFRGVSSSQGDGVYKSTDAGKTWIHLGLKNTRQISSVRIHPEDPDTIWIAAQGDSWAPNQERGVYMTTDGGETWRKVLEGANATTGAVDLKYDPINPRIVYASLWDHEREPWEIRSGGPGSSLWRSSDGGETWENISEGLPKLLGKMGIAPSPAKSGLVWAIVEAKDKGGLYRSDDGGETWNHVNGETKIQARSWYYMHIFADPKDANTVYVQNAPFLKSEDGGKTFSRIRGPHGDHHDLWINPERPNWMIDANDGGATVTFDAGKTWSSIYNQPTAQFYRVNTDNLFAYRLYAGQQDNSTIAILSRAPDGSIGPEDYHAVGGCESGHVAFDPNNPRYVYAGCYLGQIDEYDSETKTVRDINAYPEMLFGVAPRERRYRINWNAPITVSAHNPETIYHGRNVLLKSTDRGASWSEISPDLTRNESSKQGEMGTPITNEVTENYNTLLTVTESPHSAGVLWAGTDDGLVHVTQNEGGDWRNVTPRGVGEAMINSIDVSPHDPDTVYIAATRYKSGDRTPLVYRTTNAGGSWRQVARGIGGEDFVRVVREDTEREGLLFAGTESGVYVSFNSGDNWRRLQSNLPHTPITDLKIQGRDLVVATQGRAFWILDDISPLRQYSAQASSATTNLYTPEIAYRVEGSGGRNGGPTAPNPPNGAVIYYSLGDDVDLEATEITLEVLDSDGDLVRLLKTDKKKGVEGGGDGSAYKLAAEKGLNRAVWDLRRNPLPEIEGVWTFGLGDDKQFDGPRVGPGQYTIRLTQGDRVTEQPLQVEWDPRLDVSAAAIAQQQDALQGAFDMLSELQHSIISLRSVKAQAETRKELAEADGANSELVDRASAVIDDIEAWEGTVVRTQRESLQDALNWGDLLHTDLSLLVGLLDGAHTGLTQGMRERLSDLENDWRAAMARRDAVVNGSIAAFNAAFENVNADGLETPAFTE